MIPIPKATPLPKIQRLSLKDWLKGTVTAYDDGRTPSDGLRASGNVILDQDGTIRPRPSLVRYGTQPTGTILGEMFECVLPNGTANETWLITMQSVGGVGRIYMAKDGGAWQQCTGKTYDATAAAHFCQLDKKVLVMNGTDNLSYIDLTTKTITAFTALTTPAAPTPTATGLTGSSFTYYYIVTANSTVGETAASTAAAVVVSTLRDIWTPASQYVTLTWTAVTNATSYNVYLATTNPATSGTGYLIGAGINGTTFKDDGSAALDVSRSAPVVDSTAGPKVTRGSVVNGQVFLVGDKDNPYLVRFGGDQLGFELDFSPFNGGGTTEVGRGTKEFPVRVMSFRDGHGSPVITVLCRGTNGTGKRYVLTPQTTTIGDTTLSFFGQTEDNGQDGTDSPDGVVLYRDSLWYPSRDGFKTTGTKPQLQNILSTDTVSETIVTDVRNLNNQSMDKCVGLAYQGRIYWAVPNGTTANNEIWVLDLNRGGAWMKPWNIAASWMVLYNDNQGQTHQLVLSNNVIYELTYAQSCNDDGVAFSTNATSGILKFSEDTLDWAKVIDITFVLLRPQGTVNFTVSGKTEDSSLQAVGASSFTASSSVAGWGEAGWAGWGGSSTLGVAGPTLPKIYGWSNFSVIPVAFGDTQKLVTIEVDEELEWLEWELDTNTAGTNYQLADVIVRYVVIGVKDLT